MASNQGRHGLDPRTARRLIDAQRQAKADVARPGGSRKAGATGRMKAARPADGARPSARTRAAGSQRPTRGPRFAPNAQRGAGGARPGSARVAGGAGYDGSEGDLPTSFSSFLRTNGRGVISVIATLVVVVIILFAVRGCVASGDQEQQASSSSAVQATESSSSSSASTYVNPYDWSNLSRTNGRYTYSVGGQVVSRLGVDVSEHQELVNWSSVAADGIDFAIVRVGYRGSSDGDIHADQYFAYNIDGAQAAGLDTGVYFFSQANTVEEAQEEADFVVSQLGGRSLVYPVVFDSESNATGIGSGRTASLSRTQMTQIAQAFCQRIEEAGYRAMVYGNTADMARYNLSGIADYPTWWAEYGQPYPTARMDFTMWQYTNTGSVAGIDGDVDLSIDLSAAL